MPHHVGRGREGGRCLAVRLLSVGLAATLALNVSFPTAYGAPARSRTGLICTWISTAQDLQNITADRTDDRTLNLDYCLQNDIDLSTLGKSFWSIGTNDHPFTGSFDGNGHTIRNLYLVANPLMYAPAWASSVGLFGFIAKGAWVRALHLENVHVSGGDAESVGALAGACEGDVTDIDVSGTVDGSGLVAGSVIGFLGTGATMTGSHSSAAVTHVASNTGGPIADTGGLVGQNQGRIIKSYNTGPVTEAGAGNAVGGVTGMNEGFAIDQSYNTGPIIAGAGALEGGLVGVNMAGFIVHSYNTGSVSDQGSSAQVGGLVGENQASIVQSYSTGAVSEKGSANEVGGLVGRSYGAISQSFHIGTVDGGDQSTAGGLVGAEYHAVRQGTVLDGTISETYSAGPIIAGSNGSLGGLVGQKKNSAADGPIQSFFDASTCSGCGANIGVGRSTQDMTTSSAFAGWDFTAVWHIEEGVSYPFFSWAATPPLAPLPTRTATASPTVTSTSTAVESVTVAATSPSTALATPTGLPSVSITPAGPLTQVIDLAPLADRRYGEPPFQVHATGGGSGNPVTYRTTGNCTATGSSGGVITLTGAGTCTVEAQQARGGPYAAAIPVARTFSILRGHPTISWPRPASIAWGTRLGASQLTARALVAGTFRYTPGAGTILPVGVNQSLSVSFTPADWRNWDAVTASTIITVVPAVPHVILMPLANRTYGDPPVRLGVSGNSARTATHYSVYGTCILNPRDVSLVRLTGAGSCTVSAYQPGTAEYRAVSMAPVTFKIAKAWPTINWPRPKPMNTATRLSQKQLNAKAMFQRRSLPGVYAYTPKLGTQLRAGTWTLRVQFTPRDSRNFVTAVATTTLLVLTR